ncbi:hypothetical protein GN156_16375 [bacterium LRH843]|nr:hypothetical protein [bacterium LRH843]
MSTKVNEIFNTLMIIEVQVKSKKKRIRQKALKRALSLMNHAPSIEQEIQNCVDTVRGLPVTTLLLLGKKYFKEEAIIKYYYQPKQVNFYKNKEMLEAVLQRNGKALPQHEFLAYLEDVKQEWNKRNMK